MSVSANSGVRHRQWYFHSSWPGRNWPLWSLGLLLVLLAVGGGYYHRQQLTEVRQQSEVRLQAYERELQRARLQAAGQLNRLAGEVGMLQARLDRLNATSSLLANHLELDSTQLDEISPAVGGPEPSPMVQASLNQLLMQVDQMTQQLTSQQSRLDLLESVASNNHIASEGQVSGAPVAASRGWETSPYGLRQDPFTRQVVMHNGIDFGGQVGTPIIATGAGVVSWAGESPGYGWMVEISHAAGLVTRYAHAESVLVKVGDVVSKGQTVALMGNSGRSTGPHVHYEVIKRGRPLNPGAFVYHRRQ